jgi:hypothetical protein
MGDAKFEYEDVVVAVALCPPACRLVFVAAWCATDDGDETEHGHSFRPVVAVRSTVTNRYVRRKSADFPPRRYATHKEMLEHGWVLQEQEADDALLVLDDDTDMGLLPAGDPFWYPREANCAYRMCQAPWPPAEDEERLRPVVEEMLGEIRRRREDRAIIPPPPSRGPAGAGGGAA